jgi:3-hydroxybutyryl-CoA dehydratase
LRKADDAEAHEERNCKMNADRTQRIENGSHAPNRSGPLYFEDLHVGETWVSDGRTVTETDVVMFAGLTGDYNPLHVDREFAKETPFGKPIAHGLLGMSLVAGLGNHAPLVKTAAFVSVRDWKFLEPTFIGDTVHVTTEVMEKQPRGRRRGEVVWMRRLVRHDGTTLQEGLFESLVMKRQPGEAVSAPSPLGG